MKKYTDLSPNILCRFRLGLLSGVRSLMVLISSTSFNAFLSAAASMGSESARPTPFTAFPLSPLITPDRGIVFVSDNEAREGKRIQSVAQETVVVL